VTKAIFDRADDLTAVLEGLGVRDFDLKGKAGDRHDLESPPPIFRKVFKNKDLEVKVLIQLNLSLSGSFVSPLTLSV
jgi:hypothetical protein